jgi:hypothetical protein
MEITPIVFTCQSSPQLTAVASITPTKAVGTLRSPGESRGMMSIVAMTIVPQATAYQLIGGGVCVKYPASF